MLKITRVGTYTEDPYDTHPTWTSDPVEIKENIISGQEAIVEYVDDIGEKHVQALSDMSGKDVVVGEEKITISEEFTAEQKSFVDSIIQENRQRAKVLMEEDQAAIPQDNRQLIVGKEKEEEVEEAKISHVQDLYDILNNLDGASYVESEGENCIRVDFENGGSAWFELYPTGKSVRGNAGSYNSEVLKVAKKYGFKADLDAETEVEVEAKDTFAPEDDDKKKEDFKGYTAKHKRMKDMKVVDVDKMYKTGEPKIREDVTTVEPTTEPAIKPTPRPRPNAPRSPIEPEPGIHPKPKALTKSARLFLSKRLNNGKSQ